MVVERLFEFVCELIDIQIKKYVALASGGVGPDVGMDAMLVASEVDELCEFAEVLVHQLETSPEQTMDPTQFSTIFNQVRFYLEQEYLRSHAGWLLDENYIHSPASDRIRQQRDTLAALAAIAGIDIANAPNPVTSTQKQCEHDSNAIAFRVLDFVIEFKANPAMEFGDKMPAHALRLIRKHIEKPDSRYNQEKIWTPILELHAQCKAYLDKSTLSKSIIELSKNAAESRAVAHRETRNLLLHRYQAIRPDSALFSVDFRWHNIGKFRPETNDGAKVSATPPSYDRPRFFMLVGTAAAIAIMALIIHLLKNEDGSLNHITTPKL
jgi:hypothetical protein